MIKLGIHVDPVTIKQHYPSSMYWHVDETYIRVNGKWRYLWRIVDEHGRFVDFRLSAKRDAKAAKAFLNQANRNCELYSPATIATDKAPTYPALIKAMDDHAYFNQPIEHINVKWKNNRIDSDHAALKRLVNLGKGFKSLKTAKKTLLAIEAFRTIKRGDLFKPAANAAGEIRLVNEMFGIAA